MSSKNIPDKIDSMTFHEKILKTIFLNGTFFSMGLGLAVIGPTLLDLTDILKSDISSLSFLFALRSLGGILGSLTAGVLLDKYERFRFWLLFAWSICNSVTISLLPFSGYLPVLFFLALMMGYAVGSIHTGGNILCLDLWKGAKNGDPYLHSIHFAFAFGAFIAPIIAEPFLCNKSSSIEMDKTLGTLETEQFQIQNSSIENSECFQNQYLISGMHILYPIIGITALLSSFGYLVYAIKHFQEDKDEAKINVFKQEKAEQIDKKEIECLDKTQIMYKRTVVIILLAFLFTYVGLEIMFGTYIATFAVESELHLSRQEAALVNAAFWGSFALMRFASIFIAFRINSLYQLMFSFTMCGIGVTTLVIAAEKSVYLLYICSGVMGTGMASIWACGILWLKQHINVTNRIGSLLIVAGSLGGNSFLIMMGQFISQYPMLLMYIEICLVFVCILIFLSGYFVAKRIK